MINFISRINDHQLDSSYSFRFKITYFRPFSRNFWTCTSPYVEAERTHNLESDWPSSLKMLLNPSRHPGHLMIPMCPSHRPSSLKMLLNPSHRHGLLMTMHLRPSLRPSHSMFPSMFFWPSILTRFTRNTASPSSTYWLATPLYLSPHVFALCL